MKMRENGIGGEGMSHAGMLTRTLSLLGGPVRMEIIRHLAAGPRPVGQLAEETGQSIGIVSHNLRLLREADLVSCTPKSRQRIYSLAPGIRVRHQDRMLDLGFSIAEEGHVTLSLPLPTSAEVEPPQVHVSPGLTEQLDQGVGRESGNSLARRA